jgi:hypothetical protein
MRVYLAATLPLLRQWLAAGQAPPGPGQAVTPTLREWYREGSHDEMEYVAQLAAARAALGLLDADPDAPRRRVVIVAEVPDLDVSVDAGNGRAAVVVGGAVPTSAWASAMVDDEDSEAVVSAAVTALGGAAAGEDDALFALDEAASRELGWYAVQELSNLFPA